MPDPQPAAFLPAAEDPSPGVTLSEEELVIDTELVETGRARLVKRVELETVTRTIQLRREVLEIERVDSDTAEPPRATGADGEEAGSTVPTVLEDGVLAPGSLQEGVIEIVLMQEEALITTQLVPRQRVRLAKQIVTEDRTIEADLRADRVDLVQRPADAADRPK